MKPYNVSQVWRPDEIPTEKPYEATPEETERVIRTMDKAVRSALRTVPLSTLRPALSDALGDEYQRIPQLTHGSISIETVQNSQPSVQPLQLLPSQAQPYTEASLPPRIPHLGQPIIPPQPTLLQQPPVIEVHDTDDDSNPSIIHHADIN